MAGFRHSAAACGREADFSRTDKATFIWNPVTARLNVAKRWMMRNVWPVRYAVSPLVAVDGRVAVTETLECAIESMVSEAG